MDSYCLDVRFAWWPTRLSTGRRVWLRRYRVVARLEWVPEGTTTVILRQPYLPTQTQGGATQ